MKVVTNFMLISMNVATVCEYYSNLLYLYNVVTCVIKLE
jgi:hypothetical protein